jgi:cytidyltransferase-like protein
MATQENAAQRPRVMVSGCFDLLHSGHVAFLEEAAELGELHVALGSDRTVLGLKGRPPVNTEIERRYLVDALKCVHRAYVSSGSGLLDFLPELEAIKPTIFFVNADGDSDFKRATIEARGVQYRVAQRRPHGDLVARSTTALRQVQVVPYRLDLAGGWLDQPVVSQHAGGPVINCSLEPREEYELRSGMSSSTRRTAIALWGPKLPASDRERLARMIFAFENPPGTANVAGSQDAIGIVYPGVNYLYYEKNGGYWPNRIVSTTRPDLVEFLERHLQLVFTEPRPTRFEVLTEQRVTADGAKRLAAAAEAAWVALLACDADAFGRAMTESFDAQVAMFPLMVTPQVCETIELHRGQTLGHKITGAGGGGYVVFFSEKLIPGAARVSIRTEE